MKESANQEIRNAAKRGKVRHWEIADAMGMSENRFCIMLRHELTEDAKEKVLHTIEELSK